MQITIKGEMTIPEMRKAIHEMLHTLEVEFALTHSSGATLYVNPVDGDGGAVVARDRFGKTVTRLISKGPYKTVADEFKF